MKTKKAFSLTELLLILAIMAIAAGILMVRSDSAQKAQRELENEGRKLTSIIRGQQTDALSGKNATAGCVYTIQVVADSADITISGCNNFVQKLISNVKFQNAQTVSFARPVGKVADGTGTVLASDQKLDFILTKNSQTYVISVFGSGNITEGL